jgi:hypothetical protein
MEEFIFEEINKYFKMLIDVSNFKRRKNINKTRAEIENKSSYKSVSQKRKRTT